MSEQNQAVLSESTLATALRRKYRWSRPNNGQQFNLEDLWDLSLDQLDTIAVSLHKQLKETDEVSFVNQSKTSAATAELNDKFAIVKHIIDVKLAEKAARESEAKRRADKQRLLALIDRKENEAQEGKSIDELRAELAAME